MKFKSPLGSLLSAAALASALTAMIRAEEPENLAPSRGWFPRVRPDIMIRAEEPENLAPAVDASARRAVLVTALDAPPSREIRTAAVKESAAEPGAIRRGVRLTRSRFDPPAAANQPSDPEMRPSAAGGAFVPRDNAPADGTLGDLNDLPDLSDTPPIVPSGKAGTASVRSQAAGNGGSGGPAPSSQDVEALPPGPVRVPPDQGAPAQDPAGQPNRLVPPANVAAPEPRAGDNTGQTRIIPLGPGNVAAPPPPPLRREIISTPPAQSDEYVSEPSDEVISATQPGPGGGPATSYISDDFWDMTNRWIAPGFFTGAQLTMLTPMGEDRPAVTLTDLVSQQTWTNDSNSTLATGVRAWAGFQTPNALGFRVTYWTMGNDLANPEPVVPYLSKPATIDVFHLRAQTLDVEMINSFCFGRGLLDVSLGARYAMLDRNVTALGFGDVGGPGLPPVSLYGLANVSNSISGTGFTTSIGGRRPIGACDPIASFANRCGPAGWSMFWNLRGSVLWGESSANARTEALAVTKFSGGSTAFDNQASYACSDSDTLKIGDLQLGLAYQRALRCRPGVMTFQVALEGQTWSAGNASARAESNAFLAGGPPLFGGRASAVAFSEAGGLNLLGITLGVGLSF